MIDDDDERFVDTAERFARFCAGALVFIIGAFVVVAMVICAGGCSSAKEIGDKTIIEARG